MSLRFLLVIGLIWYTGMKALAQDGVIMAQEFTNASPSYYDYIFENIDDSTYFSLRSEGRRTHIAILDHNLDTLFSETYRVKFDPSKFVKILPFDANSFGVYFYQRKNWGFFQLGSRLYEFTFDFDKHRSNLNHYNMYGHISGLRIERFNNKTVVAGNTQLNLGVGINLARFVVPLAIDLLTLSSYRTDYGGYNFVQSPGSTIGLYALNIVLPFYRYRKDRNFLAELRNGLAINRNEGRFQNEEVKKASLEDMLVKNDTLLYLAYTNSSKKQPSIVIDGFSTTFRKVLTGASKPDLNNRVLYLDLYPSAEDSLRFNSIFLSRKGYNKGTNLMEVVYPRTFLHKKLSKDDATEGDDEFESIKPDKVKKKDLKRNNKDQSLLGKNAKSVRGVFFIDTATSPKKELKSKSSKAKSSSLDTKGGPKKEIKTKIKTRRAPGRDVIPVGENFRSRSMYSNERVRYGLVDGVKHKYTLRQLYYVKPNSAPNQSVMSISSAPTIGGTPSNSAIGEVAPLTVSPTLAIQKVGYTVVSKNLSIRIDNLETGDYSQFIVDKEFFYHEMAGATNQVEKMQSVLNVIDGKAFVSIVDKDNNLKTYRYTMDGGELIYINRLAEATEVPKSKKIWSKILFMVADNAPFGYFDIDLNMGDETSFILTSYVKMLYTEDGETLKGRNQFLFLLQKYEINPDARVISPSEIEKHNQEQSQKTHKSKR